MRLTLLVRMLKGLLLTFSIVATLFAFQNFAATSKEKSDRTRTEQVFSKKVVRARITHFFQTSKQPVHRYTSYHEYIYTTAVRTTIKVQSLIPTSIPKFSPQKIAAAPSDEDRA